LKKQKNIIPILLEGFEGFPENLPADIKDVAKKNGPQYNQYYFDEFYKKLKTDFLETRKSRFFSLKNNFDPISSYFMCRRDLVVPARGFRETVYPLKGRQACRSDSDEFLCRGEHPIR